MARIVVSLLMVVALSACFPERQTRVPQINGAVTKDGHAAADIPLALSLQYDACAVPVQKIRSSPDGSFQFQRVKDWGVGKVFVSPEQTYTICMDAGEGLEVAFTQRTSRGPAPEVFACNVNAMKCDKTE